MSATVSNRLSCEPNDKKHDQKRNRDDNDARYRQILRPECFPAAIPQLHALPLHHVQVRTHCFLCNTNTPWPPVTAAEKCSAFHRSWPAICDAVPFCSNADADAASPPVLRALVVDRVQYGCRKVPDSSAEPRSSSTSAVAGAAEASASSMVRRPGVTCEGGTSYWTMGSSGVRVNRFFGLSTSRELSTEVSGENARDFEVFERVQKLNSKGVPPSETLDVMRNHGCKTIMTESMTGANGEQLE
ncbi:hypothetical protein EDB87DRAFT_1579840 [Lactarius vividus]|nr:hypothetical protein EDB87DRAFT_1579840 [Lactarius vividus]